jgi:hypothetical protein
MRLMAGQARQNTTLGLVLVWIEGELDRRRALLRFDVAWMTERQAVSPGRALPHIVASHAQAGGIELLWHRLTSELVEGVAGSARAALIRSLAQAILFRRYTDPKIMGRAPQALATGVAP